MNTRPGPRPGTAALCLLTLTLGAGTLCAQQTIQIMPDAPAPAREVTRPSAAGRVVRIFDFEERQTNPGEVPEHWFRRQDARERPRPGFPAWNRAELRFTEGGGLAAEGEGSVRLPTTGGSTSLVLDKGVVPVFQNADYLLSAKVRTRDLTHARAALAARFLDGSGRPIPASEARSSLVASDDYWSPVTVELVGSFPEAAYIQLELLLLQPQQQHPQREAAPTTIWAQDFKGEAWFDEVSVVQLPRIELRTSHETNIIAAPEQPELHVLVRDLTGETLVARMQVIDIEGRTADSAERRIGSGFSTYAWKPRLTRFGWYRATMEIAAESGSRVGRTYVDFLWTPGVALQEAGAFSGDAAAVGDRARFGLTLTELPPGLLGRVPEIARRTGVGAVTLPAWDRAMLASHAADRAEALRPVIEALIGDRRQVGISLAPVPEVLTDRLQLDPEDAWALLAGDQREWMPFLAPHLEHFGPRVSHWQIGPAPADRALWREDLQPETHAITRALAKLVPGPVLGVPTGLGSLWPHDAPPLPGPRLVQAVPPDATPQAVGLAVRTAERFLASGRGELSLVLEPLLPSRYGVSAGAIETAKRAVEFWAACSQDSSRLLPGASISLQEPWAWVTQGRRAQLMPRPEAGVWRGLLDRLAGRRVVGVYPTGPGAVCYILAPAPGSRASRGGALVAWNESSQGSTLTGEFGDNLRLIDIFGNTTPVPRPPRDGTSRPPVRIPLSGSPVFLEGVDVPLVRFAASFGVEPPHLESSSEQHEREMVLTNPWDVTISGQVTILEPGGFESGQKDRTWRISPRSQRFAVAPGKTERIPFKIAFSPVEEVGPKPFVAALELTADRPYGTIEVQRTIEVAVRHISVDVSAAAEGPGGEDLGVETLISNTGASPLTLEITAFAEGHPRSKASITGLAPGNQAVRRFSYPGAAGKLRGQRIVVSVFDPETKARVNKSVLVP